MGTVNVRFDFGPEFFQVPEGGDFLMVRSASSETSSLSFSSRGTSDQDFLFISLRHGPFTQESACLKSTIPAWFTDDAASKFHGSLNLACQKSAPLAKSNEVIAAPPWLRQRMETLRRMPPPTLQEVDTQLKASAGIRQQLTNKQPA